jgi:hypothetical protein
MRHSCVLFCGSALTVLAILLACVPTHGANGTGGALLGGGNPAVGRCCDGLWNPDPKCPNRPGMGGCVLTYQHCHVLGGAASLCRDTRIRACWDAPCDFTNHEQCK